VAICAVIEDVLAQAPNSSPSTVEDVLEADATARDLARRALKAIED
jgi:1-deoxy-D-xylulose 5-phosphate reductoisomerase